MTALKRITATLNENRPLLAKGGIAAALVFSASFGLSWHFSRSATPPPAPSRPVASQSPAPPAPPPKAAELPPPPPLPCGTDKSRVLHVKNVQATTLDGVTFTFDVSATVNEIGWRRDNPIPREHCEKNIRDGIQIGFGGKKFHVPEESTIVKGRKVILQKARTIIGGGYGYTAKELDRRNQFGKTARRLSPRKTGLVEVTLKTSDALNKELMRAIEYNFNGTWRNLDGSLGMTGYPAPPFNISIDGKEIKTSLPRGKIRQVALTKLPDGPPLL